MPSGIVHAQASVILAVPAFALAFGASANPVIGLSCALGCLAGIALTPDLDQESISTSEYWLIKWTLGLGFLWTMLWYPYARLCKHRSVLSHFPIIGTGGRLLYVGLFVAVAVYFGWTPPILAPSLVLWPVVGLLISDTAHWFMDMKWGDRPSRRRRVQDR